MKKIMEKLPQMQTTKKDLSAWRNAIKEPKNIHWKYRIVINNIFKSLKIKKNWSWWIKVRTADLEDGTYKLYISERWTFKLLMWTLKILGKIFK